MNVVIGLDPHKASNTIAMLDRDENVLFRRRFANSDAGFEELMEQTRAFPDRVWAVEGAAGMGRSIAQQLVAGGETVTDVPAKLAAQVRVYGTGHGRKTDTTDAISIAKAAMRSKRVRPVTSDDGLVALKLLVDRRRELVAMRVQAMCRLHRLLRELIPGGAKLRLSTREATELLNNLEVTGAAATMRRQLALEHLADVEAIDERTDEINDRIQDATRTIGTTLVDIRGIALISAAEILAETGDVSRFPSKNHFASYTGTAPIDVSSGNHDRHRLSRAGNRRLNSILHVAAITQIRYPTPGRVYFERKLAEGKTKKEALRCLKRRISDTVYRHLRLDATTRTEATPEKPASWPSLKSRRASYRSTATPRVKPHPPRSKNASNSVAPGSRRGLNQEPASGATRSRTRPQAARRPKLPALNPPS